MHILAPENEFSERKTIFSTVFGTKFIVIRAANILKIGKQIMFYAQN